MTDALAAGAAAAVGGVAKAGDGVAKAGDGVAGVNTLADGGALTCGAVTGGFAEEAGGVTG